VIVAVNKFADDTPAEMELLTKAAMSAGAVRSVVSDHFAAGGAGAVDLANAIEEVCVAERAKGPSNFKFLCESSTPSKHTKHTSTKHTIPQHSTPQRSTAAPWCLVCGYCPAVQLPACMSTVMDVSCCLTRYVLYYCCRRLVHGMAWRGMGWDDRYLLGVDELKGTTIKDKIEAISREIYGADGCDYTPEVEKKIDDYTRLGYDELPICMAKTHLSFSADASAKGAPVGFRIPISDLRASIGAGFIYPIVGTMSTMPGLPTRPALYDIEIDTITGKIDGLF
jgi:formyltetrahydrofolate synthetase